MPKVFTVSQQLARAIQADLRGLREIARQTEIDNGNLSRFVDGKRGLSIENFDRLCRFMDLELQPREKQKDN
jgi:hypothetical protein